MALRTPFRNQPPQPDRPNVGWLLLAIAGTAMAAVLAIELWPRFLADYLSAGPNSAVGTDFRIYYFAARMQARGLDPYDFVALNRLIPHPNALAFVYPPHVLWLFRPLLLMPYEVAQYTWLALRLVVLAAGIVGWHRALDDRLATLVMLCLLPFAFGAALPYDLAVGNATTFEFALVGWSFAFLRRQKLAPATALIALAATFKVLPLAFLAVPLFARRDRHTLLWCMIAVAIVAAPLVADAVVDPAATSSWLFSLRNIYWIGYSLLALFLALAQGGSAPEAIALAWKIPQFAHVLAAAGLLVASWVATRRQSTATVALAAVGLAAVLCMPRLWVYSFVPAIPLAAAVTAAGLRRGASMAVCAVLLTLLAVVPSDWPGMSAIDDVLGGFSQTVALLCFWALAVALSLHEPATTKQTARSGTERAADMIS